MRAVLCSIVVAILVVSDVVEARKKHKRGCPPALACPPREKRMATEGLEQNITELWRHVDAMSHPVHVHVHGDQRHVQHSHDFTLDEGGLFPEGHAHKHASRTRSTKSVPKTPRGTYHHGDHARPHSPGGKKHSRRHGSKHTGHVHEEGQGPFHGHDRHLGFGHDTHLHIHVTVDEPQHRCMHHGHEQDMVYAACTVVKAHSFNQVEGKIYFRSKGHGLQMAGGLSGLETDGVYSMHVHEFGDYSDGCYSLGDEYNPHGNHSTHRHHHHHSNADQSSTHALGHVEVNTMGTATLSRNVTDVTLIGHHTILGRSIAIHQQEEQNASPDKPIKRIGCCIITRIGEPMDVSW